MTAGFMEWKDVKLRPREKDDAEFLQQLVQHPEVRDTIGRMPRPASLKEQKDYIEEASSDEGAAHFLIEYRGERAGSASVHGLEDDYRRAEFGISVHPDF